MHARKMINGIAPSDRHTAPFQGLRPTTALVSNECPNPPMHWESEIRECFARRNTSVRDLARIVHAARMALPYGDWTHLWMERRLPFSKRKAEMLVVVGREFGELDAETFARLPGGWSILYQLALLRRPDFETLLVHKRIHPALTLAEAKRLVAQFKGQPDAKNPRLNFKLRLRHFIDFVHEISSDLSAADRDLGRAELFQLALDLKDVSVPLLAVNRLVPDCNSLANGSPNNCMEFPQRSRLC